MGCDATPFISCHFPSNLVIWIPLRSLGGRYPLAASWHLIIIFLILFLLTSPNLFGYDSVMLVLPWWGFKPTVVYFPSPSATGIHVFPRFSALFFALSRSSSAVNIFCTWVIFWMESCHGINIKTVSPITVFMCAPETVLTTCRSSITDSIWPFNIGFRRILLVVLL